VGFPEKEMAMWKIVVGRRTLRTAASEREARRAAKRESRKRHDCVVARLGRFEAFYVNGKADGYGLVIG
jgi:hypothetical protein